MSGFSLPLPSVSCPVGGGAPLAPAGGGQGFSLASAGGASPSSAAPAAPAIGGQGFGSGGVTGAGAIAQATSAPKPTIYNVTGPGLGYINDILGPNAVKSTEVGLDPDMAYLRAHDDNGLQAIISNYLGGRIDEGRDLDPNINVEKRYTSGSSTEVDGKEIHVIDPNGMKGMAYHNFGGNVNAATNFYAVNELADATAKSVLPSAQRAEIETVGQSVNARLNPAVSFSDIVNWRADATDMSNDPKAPDLGPGYGNLGDALANNYSNLFTQTNAAIDQTFQSNGVNATSSEFNSEFLKYRADPQNNNIPRMQLMKNFTNMFVKEHAASGSQPDGPAILQQMQNLAAKNLQSSAQAIVQKYR